MRKNTPILTFLIILILSGSLLASDPVIVDTTGMDFQKNLVHGNRYWLTGDVCRSK